MINYRINWVLDRQTFDGTYFRMRVKWNNSKTKYNASKRT